MSMNPQDWDIPAIVAAALADDPDINPDDLAASLAEIQAGEYHPVTITAITETLHKTDLSQNKFAALRTRKKIIEQRGAHTADMLHPRRRWSVANTYFVFHNESIIAE